MLIFSRYENFDLEIEALGKDYRAHVIASPVGQVDWTPFTLPFSPSQMQRARALFGRVRNLRPVASSEPALDPKVFGAQLYNTVFGGEIGRCLNRSLERVGSETGLRIRLRLNNAPDLADLPWEYLCAPPPFDFFALSARTPIVRYLATQSAETPLTATLPLRILVVIANPSSREFPALDVEAEWMKLQAALADLLRRQLVVLERLAAPTLDALSQRLRTTTEKEPVHLLHFIGHGATNVLLFEDTAGNPHLVAADVLGKILREHRWLRLVFLNACEGGRSEESDIFMGVAPQLVEKEVPAVIAMKYAVTDRAAIELASQFYAAIADGYPVDAALAEARRAIYAGAATVEWGTPLLFMRSTDSALIDPLDLATIPACPYPGMVPFSAKDARFFFGRQAEIDAMRRHLRHQSQLFVIGPSGSGKSSLVFAGLLPALEMQDAGKWQVCVLRPGAAPQAALQEAVGDLITFDPTVALKQAATSTSQLLIVVDQFEELFVQNGKGEQNAFIAQLKVLRQLAGVALIITMRADFYPDLMNSDFWPIDGSQRMEIAPLRGDALRAAIEQPARAVKVTLESGLVEQLLADAADEPGMLPLLQETMILLWDEQKRRVLPLAAYHALGTQGRSGLAVAMATKADATLANLSPAQQTIARCIFLRLVQFGEGRSDTRRQQSLRELRQVTDEASLVDETLKQLVENRLLTLSGESSDPERKVDIAHEMLIVGWPTSQSWVQSRREAELTRRRLEEKAKEWVRLGKERNLLDGKEGGLLDEAELAEAERWMASADAGDLGYSVDLQKLTETSRQAIQKAADEEEAARQREEEGKRDLAAQTARTQEQQRRATVLRRFAYGLAVLALVAAVATVVALLQSREADTQRQKAEQQTEIAVTKQAEAEIARDDANENADAAATAEAVAKRLKDQINADQIAQKALLANVDSNLEYYPQRALLLGVEAVQLVSPPVPSALQSLYDLLHRAGGMPLSGHEASVNSVAFTPDGKTLASSSDDNTIRLWQVDNPSAEPVVLRGHEASVRFVTFAPDGKLLASASSDGTIRLWQVDNPSAKPVVMREHENWVNSVAFAPDGKLLASASSDGTIRLWQVDDPGAKPVVLRGEESWVNSVAFAPDGKTLASASSDGAIRLWQVADPSIEPVLLRGHELGVSSVVFAPDGKTMASSSYDNTIRLWQVEFPNTELKVVRGHEDYVRSIAFAPDGKTLASASDDNTIRLWQVEFSDGKLIVELMVVLRGHEDYVRSVVFAPDGKTLASASTEKTIRLWQVDFPTAVPVMLQEQEEISSVAFALDGRGLANASANKTIQSWQTSPEIIVSPACITAGRNLSVAEWQHYFPERAYKRTCVINVTGGDETAVLKELLKPFVGNYPTTDKFGREPGFNSEFADGKPPEFYSQFTYDGVPLKGHTGIDYGLPMGTPVLAAADGTVKRVDFDPGQFGNFIVLEHSWGESLYAQLDSMSVQLGQTVQVGSPIGYSGNSGMSNGPHLHFGIRLTPYQRDDGWGGYSDPAPYLSEQWQNFGIEPAQFAPLIVKQAEELARDGAITEAVASYQEALRLDSTLVISPEVEAGRIYAPIVVEKAAELARSGDITQAVTVFNQAIELDPQLNLEPFKEARRLAAPRLVDLGTQLARIGDIDGAIFRYELALTYDPASYFEPPVKAQIEYGRALYDKHAFAQAMQAVTVAQNISPTLDVTSTLSAYQWSELCRGGSLVGVATVVMPACERAVVLSPQDGLVYDSRGLARALTGDLAGAANDFVFYTAWAKENSDITQAETVAKRDAWIIALHAGYNPVAAGIAVDSGKIDEAVFMYDTLQTTTLSITVSADEWNNLCWHGALYGKAPQVLNACDQAVSLAPENGNLRDSRAVARAAAGNVSGAIEDFEVYLAWAVENQQLETQINQRRTWLAALRLDINLVQAYIFARNRAIDEALIIYEALEQADTNLELAPDEWNNLCWNGAQSGYANRVLFACDRAVGLDPDNGNYRDSRGFARVLTGDIQGAIEDFEFVLQWARRVNEWEEFIGERNAWLFFLKLRASLFSH